MSLNFALKDLYRNKKQVIPYFIAIGFLISGDIFFINLSSSMNINLFSSGGNGVNYKNPYFFKGALRLIYTQFNLLALLLVHFLVFILIMFITTSLTYNKRHDIAVMRALGTLPRKLYSFYLTETYLLFIFGYLLGLILGMILSNLSIFIYSIYGKIYNFSTDGIQILLLFIIFIIGIYFYTGNRIRKMGNESLTESFSGSIKYSIDSSKKLYSIPRFLTLLGFNLKISLVNTLRRKKEFRRYLVFFTLLFTILFTLGLGILVIKQSSHEWLYKAQGEKIIIIGHKDVVYHYSLMYEMYSDPNITVNEQNIDFTNENYLFQSLKLRAIDDLSGVRKVENRIIKFCKIQELRGLIINEYGEFSTIGENREGVFPIIGVEIDSMITDSEIEGEFFNENNFYETMVIGDGLAYNFFEFPLNQSINVVPLRKNFYISGVIIDSFYNGHVGYLELNAYQNYLKFKQGEVNLMLLSMDSSHGYEIENSLKKIIEKNLGVEFTCINLENILKKNHDYLNSLIFYPLIIIIIISLMALVSVHFYQNGTLPGKSNDLLIMKYIGVQQKSLKKILFFENIFLLLPALVLGLSLSMILLTTILLDRISLPSVLLPFFSFMIVLVIMTILNLISCNALIPKLKSYSLKTNEFY